ncbi:uncharacterized protein LOC116033375 [Ipomoea triloba]|uniref:uncharacterized protein LOC116033375 n=1 Tax=Ipomoea triloba TaxID=35885 RepID=UPI00125DA51D|nr:uncharacterized protein LOC116033375 [Ipomoea triloba]
MEDTADLPTEAGLDAIFHNKPPDIPAVFNRPDHQLVEDMDLGVRDNRDHGAASKSFQRALKQFVRDFTPQIICILEPKISGNQANVICSKFGFEEWLRVEAVGFSGGIWVLWKNCILEVLHTHPQFVVLQVQDGQREPWYFATVYGNPNYILKRKLFANLTQNRLGIQGAWLLSGDFNSVVDSSEVSNHEYLSTTRCADFNEWIFKEGLIDLGYIGSKYTWSRGQDSNTFRGARLDRGLSNADWKLRFSDAYVEHLPMIASDHCS